MLKQGIPGSLRKIAATAWIASLMSLCAAVLCASHQAHATIVTATTTDTIISGSDVSRVFGTPTTDLANVPYQLVFTIDDTKGTGTVFDDFSTHTHHGSHIYSTGRVILP